MNTEPAPISAPIPLTTVPGTHTMVFLFEKLPSGRYKYIPAQVVDRNEHVKAVKVSYSRGTKIINEWHPLSKLTATAPMEGSK